MLTRVNQARKHGREKRRRERFLFLFPAGKFRETKGKGRERKSMENVSFS
jgi:hypothetical protein